MSDWSRPLDFVAIPLSMRAEIWTATDANIGKALKLAMFCAEQLNGGVIRDARKWTPSEWRMRAGLRRPVTQTAPNLFSFVGDDLVVHIYNPDYEKSVLSKRKTNSNNVKNRWENNTTVSREYNSSEPKGTEEKSVVVDRAPDARRQAPVTFDELFEFLQAEYPDMPQEQIRKCADDYLRLGEKTNWTHSTGEPIHSWQATARGFSEKRLRRYSKSSGNARSREEAEARAKRRAEILEELEGVWPADAQQS